MAFSADISTNLPGGLSQGFPLGGLPGSFPVPPPVVGGVPGISPSRGPAKANDVDRRGDSDSLGALLSFDLIRENVEECLQESIRDTTGDLHALMADAVIIDLLRKILGTKGDAATIGRSLREMAAAFAALAERNGRPETALVAMSSFTQMLQTLYRRIADLREFAAGTLRDAVDEANALLDHLVQLNGQIIAGAAVGARESRFLRERDRALEQLAATIDFTSFIRSDGSVALFSKKGADLVDGRAVMIAIAAPAARSISDPEASDPGAPIAGPPIADASRDETPSRGPSIAGVAEITAHFSTGAVHALVISHEKTLPGVQCQLDTLAQTLQSRLNQVSNRAIAGPDARRAYEGSRCFADPLMERISIAGGDTVVMLLGPDQTMVGRTSLIYQVKRFRQTWGLPDTDAWPIGQTALALNAWLTEQLGAAALPYAAMTAESRLMLQIPPDKRIAIAFRDQRATTVQSSVPLPADRALGLKGPIRFNDGAGNRLCLPYGEIVPGDSLTVITAKLRAVSGLAVSLVAKQMGPGPAQPGQAQPGQTGHFVRLSSAVASDLTIDPDAPGATVVAGLGLLPADDEAADDIAIGHTTAQFAVSMISKPFDSASAPLGVEGILTISAATGAPLLRLAIDPGWSLEALAGRLQARSVGLAVSLQPVGNRVALRITAGPGERIGMAGKPDALMSRPLTTFSAKGGDLSLSLGPRPLGLIRIVAGSDLYAVVDRLNDPAFGLAQNGVAAVMRTDGILQAIEIGGGRGEPVQVAGSAVGRGPGLLEFRVNPRDLLGFGVPADRSVPGFANFFGLNDLFVAEPADAFDPKVPPGLFNSNAMPGTAEALAVCPRLRDNPEDLGHWSTLTQISDLLNSPVNVAAAGELPRSNRTLVDYAENIVAWVTETATLLKGDVAFKQVLLDQIRNQQRMLPSLSMDDRLESLAAFQQAHQDSTHLLSTMPKLFDSLGLHLH